MSDNAYEFISFRAYRKTSSMIHYYYDLTADHILTTDSEGNLVQLCESCARMHQNHIALAQTGDADSVCEQCGAGQEDTNG